jgi:hypothetical protein
VAADITRVYVGDAADRIAHSARQVVRALAAGARGGPVAELLPAFTSFAGIDGIAARRRISDAVVAAGKQPL